MAPSKPRADVRLRRPRPADRLDGANPELQKRGRVTERDEKPKMTNKTKQSAPNGTRVQFNLNPEDADKLLQFMESTRGQFMTRGVYGFNNRVRVLLMGVVDG